MFTITNTTRKHNYNDDGFRSYFIVKKGLRGTDYEIHFVVKRLS